ncbi:MAG TPA: TolC family protein [Planctomycetota bacterium]|nr:TolC family protein [Planctomycetota bacterium]
MDSTRGGSEKAPGVDASRAKESEAQQTGATPPAPAPAGLQESRADAPTLQVRVEATPRPVKTYEFEVRLSLEDAIRLGIENSLDIKISRLDDDIHRRELLVAKSIFDPFFNLGGSFAKNRDPSVSFFDLGAGASALGVRVSPSETLSYYAGLSGTSILGTQYDLRVSQIERDRPAARAGNITFLNPVISTEASATARQPLLRGAWYSINTAEVQVAHNNILVSREQLQLSVTNAVFAIEQAYWDLVFATKNLEAKRNTFQVATENLANVQRKKDVGTLAAIDVTSAGSQLALRRVELEEAEQLRETNRDTLLRVMNYTKSQSLKERWESGGRDSLFDTILVICTTELVPEAHILERDAALTAAFTKRPEYSQLALNTRNQEIRADVLKNGLLPALDLTGRWAHLGLDDSFDQSYGVLESGKFYDWEIGIEFSIPLSNRGPRSRYRNARDELRKLRLQKADLENLIVLEVDEAIRSIQHLRRKVVDLDERVRLQEELLRAERRKVDVGMSIAYTVSVIENDLVENQTQALEARADLETAKAEFFRATGELLERHRIDIRGSPGRE